MRTSLLVASLILVLSACGGDDSAPGDGGADGGVDGATDSAVTIDSSPPVDTGTGGDAAPTDAAVDAVMDAGPMGSVGCVDGAGLDEGEHTFMLEGNMRRYILRLPNGYTRERPWPLVLALHGNGGSTSYWDGTSGSRNIRGVLQDDAILIVAEAIDGQWRDYSMDSSTWPARIESELLYFEEVLTQAREDLCVREDAIFSMGFSGGGSFSGVLGCRRTDIRAIAVGGSVIYFDEADCVGYPAAWITIGTEELTSGREAYRDWFRDRAGCSDTSMATEPDPPCVAYDGCDPDTPVHYCQHPDGHIWPDFGSDAMWQFFSQFLD
jgi:poly(3-hydroxybutyrate) depolymerase